MLASSVAPSTFAASLVLGASLAGALGACSGGSSSTPRGGDPEAGAVEQKADDTGAAGDAGPDAPAVGPEADGGGVVVPSCSPTAPTACPSPAVTYTDIQPILATRCVTCHNGAPDGPWPLDEYEHAADWADIIRAELLSCDMPPLDASVPITNEERERLLTWVRCGAPK